MHFIFVETFDRRFWNGRIAREEKGVSGSHAAPMYLAEGLAQLNHTVDFVSLNNNMIEETYLNVQYSNATSFTKTQCDYIVITNNCQDFGILQKVRIFKKIIVVMHNDLHFHNRTVEQILSIQERLIIAYLNPFGKINIERVQPFLKDVRSIFLPNSICLKDVLPLNMKQKNENHFFCFFACVGRGLPVAVEIVKQWNQQIQNKDKTFKIFTNTYADEHRHLTQSNDVLIQTDGCSKNVIYQHLVKSKYFVYPLIDMETNQIHYDTFGYVVLEALLHGVIVIAPKIAVYEELFGDAVCYVDTEGIIPEDDLLFWKKQNANFGTPLVHKYLEKIEMLENNPQKRNEYIEKGLSIGEKFSNRKMSFLLLQYLRQL